MSDDKDDELEEGFFRCKKVEDDEVEDCMILKYNYVVLEEKWIDDDVIEFLKVWFFFFCGIGVNVDEFGDDEVGSDEEGNEDSEGDGEFEDFEIGEINGFVEFEDLEVEWEKNVKWKEELKLWFEEEDCEGFLNLKNVNCEVNG